MKRLVLTAALLLALPAAARAQWSYDDQDYGAEVAALEERLEQLRDDPRVARHAAPELARAEDYIEDLVEDPGSVDRRDVREAERLLTATERAVTTRSTDRGYAGRDFDEREPDDDRFDRYDDDDEWSASRDEPYAPREDTEDARERALAAQIEAEHARNANARLRSELGRLEARETERGLVVTLGDVVFASGKADLRPGAARTLDQLVTAMKRDRRIEVAIEGHTDSTGKRAFNLDLSQRRANAVRRYLTSRGIHTSRIQTRGLGPDHPIATNRTEAGRRQNRRVEVLVQNDAFE